MGELRLGYTDRDKTIITKVGDTLVITVPENATTGFQWNLASYTKDILSLETTDPTSASSEPLGAGGRKVTFRFTAKSIGQGEIILKLSRGKGNIESNFKFRLNIKILPNTTIEPLIQEGSE